MRHSSVPALATTSNRIGLRCLRWAAAGLVILASLGASAYQSRTGSAASAQKKTLQSRPATGAKSEQPDLAWLQDALKNPELMAEFSRLVEKMQKGVQYPGSRSESHILPRLPESTLFYAAFPNYGETIHQAIQIFQEGLKDSPNLQEFMRKNKIDILTPQFESGIEKFYQFSQFLGDEVVFTGRIDGKEPNGVLVAELKKPGVREFLEHLNDEVFTKPADRLLIFNPQQLAGASKDKGTSNAPVVLIRQDVIAIGLSVAAVRDFNIQFDQSGTKFASTALGRRMAQSYRAGTSTLVGVDLQQILGAPDFKAQDRAMLEKTGFGDLKYVAAEAAISSQGASNQVEIAFAGPRRGVASWIAPPAPMRGLDFVSANPASMSAVLLKNPAEIFDQLQEIIGPSAFASLPQMEAQLHLNLKQDLLSKLTGEIVSEMQPAATAGSAGNSAAAVRPASFKFILGVTNPDALQQAITGLLLTLPLESGHREEDGIIITTITIPASDGAPTEINYFFMDGYLIVTSNRAMARDAVRAHRSGDSLAKSTAFRDALANGQSGRASAIWYQDAGQMFGAMMAQMPPEIRSLLPAMGGVKTKPTVFTLYAENASLRGMSNLDMQAGAGIGLIGAAIAIPNLMHARVSANESAAAATVRTVNTAQVTYSVTYGSKGYAPALAVLGLGSADDCSSTNALHACLLDRTVGNASCTPGKWCEKSGYNFSMRGICGPTGCRNYAVTATPVKAASGGKSFCSTNDAVVRSHVGPPLQVPLTVAECRTWPPLQ